MKMRIRGKAIVAFAVALCLNLSAQTGEQNQIKYWNYRDRYLKQFVSLGWQEGKGINCVNIDNNPSNEGMNVVGGNAFPITNPQYGYRKWADAMTNQGNYLSVLATQYKLLKDGNKDVTATLNELYYAINAVDRLDAFGERFISGTSGTPANYNGFFIRDDVNSALISDWNNQYSITEDPRDRYEAVVSNYYSELHSSPTIEQRCDNEMSQDAVILLLQGFTFVKKMVGHVYAKPSVFDAGFYLDDKIKQITERIMNHITSVRVRNNFSYEIYDVLTSMVNGALAKNTPTVSFPPHPSVTSVCDVEENWILMNPVTNKVTGYYNGQQKSELRPWSYPMAVAAGYITGNDYVGTAPVIHKSTDIAGDGELCIVPHDKTIPLDDFNAVFWSQMQSLNWTPGALTVTFPQVCIPMINTSTTTVSSVCYDNIVFNNDALDRKYNAYYMCVYASITGTWSHPNLNTLASNWGMEIFDLMYAVINGTTPIHPKSYWENILNSAPCQGPYNYRNGSTFNFDNNWFSTDRFGGNTDPFSVTAHGEFNGNDYMLLYNLYQLAYKNTGTLPEYEDNSCPCSSSKEFSQKIENRLTTTPSGSKVLATDVTVGRKFSNYLNFDIKLKEFLIETIQVRSSKKMNVETDLVVCNNSTLYVWNDGKINVGNTSFIPSSIIVRSGSTLRIGDNGTLKVYDKSKVIIEKGGKLYIEPNANIQLLGNDAVLDIQGDVYIESNAEFTFTYPGTTSGYVRFSHPGYVNPPYTQVSGGTGSKIKFKGQTETDKILEIDQDILYVSSNNGISEFNIERGNVYFTGTKDVHYISSDVSTTLRRCLFNGLRGHLAVWGQPICDIRNCKFDGVDIQGFLFQLGNKLQVIGTEIYNTDIGIYTQGKGVGFTNLNAHNNSIGWRGMFLSENSVINNSKFNNNSEIGAAVYSSPSELLFSSSKLNENELWGLELGGPSLAKLKCSQVKQNGLYGFYLGKSSSLSMNILQGGGYVDASNNADRTIWLDEANSIDIDNGYNDLRPFTSAAPSAYTSIQCSNFGNCPVIVIEGTLKQPVGIPISVENNKWQPNNTLSLQSFGKDKFTRVVSTFTPGTILPNLNFVATQQSNKPACGTFDGYCPSCPQDILRNCTDCNLINTADFTNKKTNEATTFALDKMDTSITDGYKDAVDLLHQVLKYPSPVLSDGDKVVRGIAEREIIVALAKSIEENQTIVSDSTISSEAHKVLDIETEKINKSLSENIYTHIRDAVLEKVLVYYMLEHREEALHLLDSIAPFLQPEDHEYFVYTKCLINKELLLLNQQMDQIEFLKTYGECFLSKKKIVRNFPVPFDQIEEESLIDDGEVQVYPNPANSNLFIEYSISEQEQAQFVVYDITGKELFHFSLKGGTQKIEITNLELSSGVYLFKIVSGAKIIKQDKLTIIR